jgi:hypothetical protein
VDGQLHTPWVCLHGEEPQDPLDRRQWGYQCWPLSGGRGIITPLKNQNSKTYTAFYETRSYDLEKYSSNPGKSYIIILASLKTKFKNTLMPGTSFSLRCTHDRW